MFESTVYPNAVLFACYFFRTKISTVDNFVLPLTRTKMLCD